MGFDTLVFGDVIYLLSVSQIHVLSLSVSASLFPLSKLPQPQSYFGRRVRT